MESTSTRRVANTSPTAASTGADLNGKAVELACLAIRDRLLEVAARELGTDRPRAGDPRGTGLLRGAATDLTWEQLVPAAYLGRVNLSAQAHYATPGIHFDRTAEKGEPFAYHVYGTAAGARPPSTACAAPTPSTRCGPCTTWAAASTRWSTAARPRGASCRASAG